MSGLSVCMVLIVLCSVLYTANSCCIPSNHGVCYRNDSRVRSYTAYETHSYSQQYRCRWGRRCSRTRYHIVLVTLYGREYHRVFDCCPGYIKSGYISCRPLCGEVCMNGGTCTAPNCCSCPPGWTGDTCVIDVNECTTHDDNCQHQCHNNRGSYICSCNRGYTLRDDGRNCMDINECQNTNTNLCQHRCHNNPGSYTCTCHAGYTLHHDHHSCIANK